VAALGSYKAIIERKFEGVNHMERTSGRAGGVTPLATARTAEQPTGRNLRYL
jgi:hypothetical protein